MTQRHIMSYLGLKDNKFIPPAMDSKEPPPIAEYPNFDALQIEIPQFLVQKELHDAFKGNFKAHVEDHKKTDLSQWILDVRRPGKQNKRLITVNGKKIPEALASSIHDLSDQVSEEHEAYLITELSVQGKDMVIKQHNQAYIGFSALMLQDILCKFKMIASSSIGCGGVSSSIDVSFQRTDNKYIVTAINKDMPAISESDIEGPYQELFSKDTALGFQQQLQSDQDDYKETRKLVTNDNKLAMVFALSYLQKLKNNEVKPSSQELQQFHEFFLNIMNALIKTTEVAEIFYEYITIWNDYQAQKNITLEIQDDKSIKAAIDLTVFYFQHTIESEKIIPPNDLQKLNLYFVFISDQIVNPFSQGVAYEKYAEAYCLAQIYKNKMRIPKKPSTLNFLNFMSMPEKKNALKDVHELNVEAWNYVRKNIVKEKEASVLLDILITKIDKLPEDILIIYLLNLSVFFQAKAVIEKNLPFPDQKTEKFFQDAANPLNIFNPKQFLEKYPDAELRSEKAIEKLDSSLKNVHQCERRLMKMEKLTFKK